MAAAATPDDARHRYHVLSNTWARWGAEHFLTKLRRGWIVTVEGADTPMVFKRKRDALEHAEARVRATLERLREHAQANAEE